jgi:hypothetical protein
MNPRIPATYDELRRWLHNFATAHGKREHPAVEVVVETGEGRQGRSYGLRVVLDGRVSPPAEAPAIELSYPEVMEGRARFAWCEALAERIRAEVRRLTGDRPEARSA